MEFSVKPGKDGTASHLLWNRIYMPQWEHIQGQLIISALRIRWSSPALLEERLECGLNWWMGIRENLTYGEMYREMLRSTNEFLGDFLDGLVSKRDRYEEALDV